MNIGKLIGALVSVLISQSAGIIGSFFTFDSVNTWYKTLNKPSFSPPNWLFAPVWLTLYTMMGISSYLVYLKRGEYPQAKPALVLFGIHLALNALWSILFFGLKNPLLAFIEIIILWLTIVALIILFYKIDKIAALLLVPYLLWVSFASILNFSIWRLN